MVQHIIWSSRKLIGSKSSIQKKVKLPPQMLSSRSILKSSSSCKIQAYLCKCVHISHACKVTHYLVFVVARRSKQKHNHLHSFISNMHMVVLLLPSISVELVTFLWAPMSPTLLTFWNCESFFQTCKDSETCLVSRWQVYLWTWRCFSPHHWATWLISCLQTWRNPNVTICAHITSSHIQQFICFFRSSTTLFIGNCL